MKELIGRMLVVALCVTIGTAYALAVIEIGAEVMRWTRKFFRQIKP